MSKKTLNTTNLEALGAEKLAALLIEVSTGSADIKRRLRLELSHNLGPAELAHDVRKRLVALRNSKSFVGWRRRKTLIKDLTTQLAMITDKIGPDDPKTAFDLLWQFIELAPPIYDRVDDRRGDVGEVFVHALDYFGPLADRADLDPEQTADQIWTALQNNPYGEWDGIISKLATGIGTTGLQHLQTLVQTHNPAPVAEDHAALKFLRDLRGDTNPTQSRDARLVKVTLQEIATELGDTTSYINQYSPSDLRRKTIAAEVAILQLNDGDADAALDTLRHAEHDTASAGQSDWATAMIATLTALNRDQDAQDMRWDCFETDLSIPHLRTYLKALPDFEDVEAEERAMAHAFTFPNMVQALQFCVEWSDLRTAAQLVEHRADELDGNNYTLLTLAADRLRDRHPLAATLVFRAMIDYALYAGRSTRYGHLADHMYDLVVLDAEISDYGDYLSHDQYVAALRLTFAHKSSFWAKVRD